jgi:hypothetical protein
MHKSGPMEGLSSVEAVARDGSDQTFPPNF